MKLPEQKKVSSFWGGIKSVVGSVTFYVGILNFLLLLVTAYNTTLKYYISLPFWVYLVLMISALFIIGVIEYLWIIPSAVVFSNQQAWKHDNPVREDLKVIKDKISELENKIDNLKK